MGILTSNKLGNLKIKEVYEYYDQPLLFSCTNEHGQLFLAIWVDKLYKREKWLYVELSQQRLDDMRNKVIDIKTAFEKAQTGYVYQVRIDMSEKETKEIIEKILCEDIYDQHLPDSGEFL